MKDHDYLTYALLALAAMLLLSGGNCECRVHIDSTTRPVTTEAK
jgi:hypothetical protein